VYRPNSEVLMGSRLTELSWAEFQRRRPDLAWHRSVAAGLVLWLQGGRFEETENAYVKAHIIAVTAKTTRCSATRSSS
jgi:hypothetical protein